ncbi:mitochondrial import inner membrane translocase subunit TIM17-2 [Rosa chinensis]|nr:mitochondrial import inner membrane translocase subunit TIM17-2 [Rosa chinensis]
MWNGLPWERWSYKVIERPCSVTKPLQQARLFPSQRTSSSSSLLLYFSLFNRQNPENLNPDRETCPKPSPDHVVNVVGGTFGVGFVFGGALHFLKGIYNSPGGARLAGAAQAIRINAPLVGGRFARTTGTGTSPALPPDAAGVRADGEVHRRGRGTVGPTRRLGDHDGQVLGAVSPSALLHWYVTEEPGASMPGLPGPEAVGSEGSPGPEAVRSEGSSKPEAVGSEGSARPEAVGSEGSSSGGSWFGKGKESEAASSGSETKVLESFDAPPVQGFEIKVTWRAD